MPDLIFTEEEIEQAKKEHQQCVQQVNVLRQQIVQLETRAVELQGLLKLADAKSGVIQRLEKKTEEPKEGNADVAKGKGKSKRN